MLAFALSFPKQKACRPVCGPLAAGPARRLAAGAFLALCLKLTPRHSPQSTPPGVSSVTPPPTPALTRVRVYRGIPPEQPTNGQVTPRNVGVLGTAARKGP